MTKRPRTVAQIEAEQRRESSDALGKLTIRHTEESAAAMIKLKARHPKVSAPELVRIALIELAASRKSNR